MLTAYFTGMVVLKSHLFKVLYKLFLPKLQNQGLYLELAKPHQPPEAQETIWKEAVTGHLEGQSHEEPPMEALP